MVELRRSKRSAPAEAAPPAKKVQTSNTASEKSKPVEKVKSLVDALKGKPKAPAKGDTVDLKSFGGEVETNEGTKTTLAKLVEESKAGVVLFTYPRASTPGCTTQACLFRDSYEPLTATGLSIYGLSTDSPKSNTTFKTKYSFPYLLLCDPKATLIQAIGLKKSPSGTQRGVFVISKDGKVLAAEPGGPAATVEVVKKLVESLGGDADSKGVEEAEERAFAAEGGEVEDKQVADTAAEVADTAEKIDV